MSVIMLLVDGIGIAPRGARDPLRSGSPFFAPLDPHGPSHVPGGGWAVPTRADLDVDGLPQSATGHTAILTGINAAKVLGRHFPGFPPPTLRPILAAHNLLRTLNQGGLRARYINAYRPLHPTVRHRRLMSATTLAARSSGQRLRGLEDILEGRALHHDFTNTLLVLQGEDLPLWGPEEAGRRLAHIAASMDFALFEYFLTDLVGHEADPREARREVNKLGGFLKGLLEETDLRRTTVILCSDHGNLEDPSVRTHTRNPVPTIVWGPHAHAIARTVDSIERIPRAVLEAFSPQDGHR